ncbi:YcxB family protein [Marinicaulis aureus]|uniref:YcxB family protein n=1 Tax=Hyphococcus aureus TaxID=2666033 RepID=A0ABW1KV92_9PROT
MRVDIDKQDIANALADTRKKFDRAKAGLIISFNLLGVVFCAAMFGLWRAVTAITATAPALSVDGVLNAFHENPAPFYLFCASASFAIAAILTAVAIFKARRKRAAAHKEEALNHSLNAGRFEFIFSAEKLTIMGPLAVKKISWQNIRAIEKRKSSIVFHRKDGGYDFIPKNVIPNDNFYDLMMVKHGSLINKACPYEEAHLAKPLSIVYEAVRGDLDDYYAQYFKKRDGKLFFIRRLCAWKPWAPFLFLTFAALAVASGFVAFQTYSLVQAGAAIAAALAAGAILVTKSSYFRGPAHPFRKNADWPYAQTDLTTVSLNKEGVFHARHGATDIIKWGAFSGYAESKRFGYLVIAPKQVIALPKRAFLNKAHFEDFTLYAKRNITLAKKQKSDAEHGRMMRSLGDKEAQQQLPAPVPKAVAAPTQKPRPAPAVAAMARPGPSPQAAPAQVKPQIKPAPKGAQAKPSPKPAPQTAPAKPALVKPAQTPTQARPAQQQAAPTPEAPEKPQTSKPVKKPAPKMPSETAAILNSALKKAAQLEAKAKQQEAASAQQAETPPEKKTAAE